MLSGIMLCRILFTIMLNIDMISVIVLSVIMVSVIMLSVVAPQRRHMNEGTVAIGLFTRTCMIKLLTVSINTRTHTHSLSLSLCYLALFPHLSVPFKTSLCDSLKIYLKYRFHRTWLFSFDRQHQYKNTYMILQCGKLS